MGFVRVLTLMLIAGIGVVGFQLLGPGGMCYRLNHLENQLKHQLASNDAQRDRNEELSAELYSLVHKREAIEERARRDLFMVRKDEVLFRLESPEEQAARVRGRASMPDYRSHQVKPGAKPTFVPKRGDLYYAPKNLRAPPSRTKR